MLSNWIQVPAAVFAAALMSSAAPVFAMANESSTSVFEIPEKEEAAAEKDKPWSIDVRAELRSSQDRRDRPQNKNRNNVHEISVGGSYEFGEFESELELSVEQLSPDEPSVFFVKQALVRWNSRPAFGSIVAGQQFVPLGLVSPRDNWFSSNPPWMRALLGGSKGSDLGVTVRLQPLANEWLAAEGGVYSGQMVRGQDQRVGSPEKAPRLLSLRSHSEYHDAFASYWEHDLAFYDPIRAYGAGAELRSPEWRSMKLSVLGEFWNFEQIQRDGPDQRTSAYLLHAQLDVWRFAGGVRFSEARSHLVSVGGRDPLPVETSRLAFAQVRLAPVLVLRAERVVEDQSVVLRDEWAGRLLFDWSL